LVLQQLFHLMRRKQDPCSATDNKDDARTLHFPGEGANTAYRMVGIKLHPLNRYTRSCCFVLHALQEIVRLLDIFPAWAPVWPLWKANQRQDDQRGTEAVRERQGLGNGRYINSMGERKQQTRHDHHHFKIPAGVLCSEARPHCGTLRNSERLVQVAQERAPC
jgi:hypothetical protein